jgi:hypothetical protein
MIVKGAPPTREGASVTLRPVDLAIASETIGILPTQQDGKDVKETPGRKLNALLQ